MKPYINFNLFSLYIEYSDYKAFMIDILSFYNRSLLFINIDNNKDYVLYLLYIKII